MSSSDEILVSSSSGSEEFVVSLVTNLILGLLSLVAISIMRRTSLIYYWDGRRSDSIRNPNYIKGGRYLERPPRQSTSFFGWIWQTIVVPENMMLRSCGLDAVITLRFFLRMGVYLTIFAIATMLIIVPIQASSAENNGTTGFNALSILSLDSGSSKLWAHLIVMYLFTGFLFKLLHTTWFEILSLKQRWLSNEQLMGQKLTILVSRLPTKYCTSASLYALFEELYPGQVAGAYVVQNNERLSELYTLRENAVEQINTAKGNMELEAYKYSAQEAVEKSKHLHSEISLTRQIQRVERPRMKLTKCGSETVDVIDYYTGKLKEYDDEITTILNKISDKQYTAALDSTSTTLDVKTVDNEDEDINEDSIHQLTTPHVGFVTFRSAVTAANVVNSPISESVRQFEIEIAPEPSDISWFGLNKTPTYKFVMLTVVTLLIILLVIFYAVPVTFISAILSVEALSQMLPFLEPVLTFNPIVKGIISGLLPSLALIIFMALLPKILYGLGYLAGINSKSKIAMFVFKKYFIFQYVNFFLIACVSSTVFKELQNIISIPGKIPTLLASGLPQSALLFINYIMMRALYTNFFGMIDIADLLLNYVFYIFSRTPKATANALAPSAELHGKNLPEAVLILIIAFTFGTIQPMMLIFAALYFFTLYFAKKHTMLWITVTPYDTGAGWYPLMFNRILLGVVTGQLCLLGLFGLKDQIAPCILMIPLILLSIWYWYRYSNLFKSTEHRLTLISARVTDSAIETLTGEQKQALLEGFDLPSGPLYLSLLPFLMPNIFGDTRSREKTLQQHGLPDLSTSIDPTLYDSLLPQHVTVKSLKTNEDVQVSRDLIYLNEQYHGDDVSLDEKYKQWLLYYDLTTNPPRDILLNGVMPQGWVYKHQMEKNNRTAAVVPTTSQDQDKVIDTNTPNSDDIVDLSIDHENQLLDNVKLTIEQKILLEQLIFRWKHSQQLSRRMSTASTGMARLTGLDQIDINQQQRDSDNDDIENPQQQKKIDPSMVSNDIDAAFTQLPPPSLETMPSESTTQTPFQPHQLQDGLSRRGSLSQEELIRHNSSVTKLKGVCTPTVLLSREELEQTMLRYFTPETNPHNYNHVSDRVWGNTYIAYRVLLQRKKEEKKLAKKNKKEAKRNKNGNNATPQQSTTSNEQPVATNDD